MFVLNGVVAQIARQVPWHRRFNFIHDVITETDDRSLNGGDGTSYGPDLVLFSQCSDTFTDRWVLIASSV